MSAEEIQELGKVIASEIADKTLFCTKAILSIDEACRYMNMSKSRLYQLTCAREIPHFKQGRLCYFDRVELENWLRSNPVMTQQEINSKAQAYCMRGVKQ